MMAAKGEKEKYGDCEMRVITTMQVYCNFGSADFLLTLQTLLINLRKAKSKTGPTDRLTETNES